MAGYIQGKLHSSANISTQHTNKVSPIRKIKRQLRSARKNKFVSAFRSFDGSNNNRKNRKMGAAGEQLQRIVPVFYSDDIAELAETGRPGPREISNVVSAQLESLPNNGSRSDFLWQWGQFLDHDIDLTDGADPAEPVNISIPAGDVEFDPENTGNQVLPFNRSTYDRETGTSPENPRQQVNEITSWIDASNVYGSSLERALALRTLDGSGQLKTSAGNLLPFNTKGLANAGGNSASLFLAGDVRANEQVGLIAMHTLFMREHNRLARKIAIARPKLNGDQIYFRARRLVAAEIQSITYREFLPALLGPRAIAPYRGYKRKVNANISNLFSTGAYRFGHSAVSEKLLRLDNQGNEIPQGHLSLRDAFFAPHRITNEGGIEPILRGLAYQTCQNIDPLVIDDVRNFLFGEPGQGGFDLVSLNIQRGRDHGLPTYNDAREALGLERKESFSEISKDPEIRLRLASVYSDVDEIDVWVGGLAENHLPRAQVGELIFHVLKRQFEALRDGDRFWHARILRKRKLKRIKKLRLADIIRLNTDIDSEITDNVFRVKVNKNRKAVRNRLLNFN